jgi:hypothetical protein
MKIGTIVLIVIIIILLIWLISGYIVNKYILTSLTNATSLQTISASSLASSNSPGNSNFAYSIWFYISNWNYKYGQTKVIFGRMLETTNTIDKDTGIGGQYPFPLVYLDKVTNNIEIQLTTYSNNLTMKNNVETFTISNIPIQQWVNFTISVYGRTLDTYINGKLVRTNVLSGPAVVDSTKDVIVTPNGGFEGSTTKLAYYPNALNPEQAWNIYEKGYGTGFLPNIFGAYQLNISILQNGEQEASLTI